MTPHYTDPLVTLYLGDCLDVMRELPDASVDSVVTDPPYGIGFMGKEWDMHGGRAMKETTRQAQLASDAGWTKKPYGASGKPAAPAPGEMLAYQLWCTEWATEAFRVLKPGGYLLAFGGTRTYHRLASAIEDAGFEIRDTLAWLYASGFPKSLSVHKATLKLVESRYAEQRCDCLDTGDGSAPRDDAGRQGRGAARARRGEGEVSSDQAGDSALPSVSRPGDDSVRDVRDGGRAQGSGRGTVEAAVLFEDMRGSGAEEAGHRHAPIRAGVEERPSEDPSSGQGVPVVRDDARGERGSVAGASPQALPVGRIESPDEPRGAMPELPPHDRSRDDLGLRLDTHRSEPRRVIPDDQVGRQGAVVRVCSWCGLPDEDYIRSLEPLGTAMKPAMEPIVMARKPLVGTVAANVTRYGTGALNIDGTRIGTTEVITNHARSSESAVSKGIYGDSRGQETHQTAGQAHGRWPSNVLLSDPELFDEPNPGVVGSGATSEGFHTQRDLVESEMAKHGIYNKGWSVKEGVREGYNDVGGYSRFFIIPKADRAERERGLAGAPTQYVKAYSGAERGGATWVDGERVKTDSVRSERANVHPTVKPIDLMRHLVRLVTPPGGVTLDPFLGSGTTALAASEEGFRCIGIEREAEYLSIAVGRLMATPMGLGLDVPAPTSKYRPPAKMPPFKKDRSSSSAVFDSYMGKDDEEPAA